MPLSGKTLDEKREKPKGYHIAQRRQTRTVLYFYLVQPPVFKLISNLFQRDRTLGFPGAPYADHPSSSCDNQQSAPYDQITAARK